MILGCHRPSRVLRRFLRRLYRCRRRCSCSWKITAKGIPEPRSDTDTRSPLTRSHGGAALQFEIELNTLDQLEQFRQHGVGSGSETGDWMRSFSEILVAPPVVEILRDRDTLREQIRRINHAPSETAALIERGVLQKFGTRLDCYSPIAVHAAASGDALDVRAFVSGLDGAGAIRVRATGRDPGELVDRVFGMLTDRGAIDVLARTR